MKNTIDKIDAKIIRLLQKNGRLPNTEISKQVGVSEATVRNRLQRLINDKYIQVVAVGNPFKLSPGISGRIGIRIDIKKIDKVLAALDRMDELWYIARVEGNTDLDVEYFVRSLEHYRQLIDAINKIDGVIQTDAAFILQIAKCRYDYLL